MDFLSRILHTPLLFLITPHMSDNSGRQRVVITNVSPQVEGGLFAAKTIAGKPLLIEADAFTDGHDEIVVVILAKHQSEAEWQELPMTFLNNDHWSAIAQ